ncbi:hypothetical protein [Pontibacter actiniarum]|uniref:Uncharacterized protein n=1 Tax=Pontibacter actiniarum TaxID=323450 RepID=A0A1X9YVW9_9BACT|nr:hypothetical protein [Pontibacter actiniarum]ARS37066.1 hypothetical protein CA264_17420 [Pontibacter actiniarum]
MVKNFIKPSPASIPAPLLVLRQVQACPKYTPTAFKGAVTGKGNYTRVYFPEAKPLIQRTFNDTSQRLAPKLFFRASRSRPST